MNLMVRATAMMEGMGTTERMRAVSPRRATQRESASGVYAVPAGQQPDAFRSEAAAEGGAGDGAGSCVEGPKKGEGGGGRAVGYDASEPKRTFQDHGELVIFKKNRMKEKQQQ